MPKFLQQDFSGGLDQLSDDTKIAPNAYRLLINGRTRLGSINPIIDSRLASAPRGKKQGLFAVGSIIVAVIAGYAYYNIITDDSWHKIPNFVMDSTVDYIYMCAVSSSTMNNKRVLNSNNDRAGSVTIQNEFTISGTPAGIVCQDGVNQPWLIFYDVDTNSASARLTKSYDEWNNESTGAGDDREYVPIGKQMFVYNGKLFIVAPNGYDIYRSVSGRPLDFMVNIDSNGKKLATEALGGAKSTSFACGFDEVTYIGELDAEHFLIGTAKNTYAVSENYNFTVFNEPTFNTPTFLKVGIVNQFSVSQARQDTTVIDFEGVKSFDAVKMFKMEGDNAPFSLQLSKLLVSPVTKETLVQDVCAAVVFDNYNIYSLKTSLGYALAVYDNIRELWVGLDITNAVKIKQFIVTTTNSQSLLYGMTEKNIYQLYGGDERATAQLHTKSFANDDPQLKHKTQCVRPVFSLDVEDGQVLMMERVDDRRGQYLTSPITGVVCGVKPPIIPPVIPDTDKLVDNKTILINKGENGFKLSYIISWDTATELTDLLVETITVDTKVSKEQQQRTILA